jgi:hypothetical protein
MKTPRIKVGNEDEDADEEGTNEEGIEEEGIITWSCFAPALPSK